MLIARGLKKAFGPQTILDDASLTIHAAERIGLVGLNGSGKSTLARLLAGIELPDSGEITRRRDATVAYLQQQPVVEAGRTVIDEVMAGLAEWTAAKLRFEQVSAAIERSVAGSGEADLARLLSAQTEAAAQVERLGGWDVSHRARSILGHLGLRDPDAPLEQLSGGEQRRVALARILVGRPQLALLDEPTNHLDLAAIEWLESFLRDELGGALLLITHDRYLIDRVAHRTLEIDRGQLHSYAGGYESYLEAKAERLAHEARAEANRQRFVRRELEWLRRQPKARTGKQKARVQRAEQALAAEGPGQQRDLSLELQAPRSSKRVVELQGLRLELGGRLLVNGLDYLLLRGQRLGIVGPNGCGKTTLLRAITGELAPSAGAVLRSNNTTFSYLTQTRDDLDDAASIADAVADGQRKVAVAGQPVDVEAYLARFHFSGDRLCQKVGALSGGERTRVALARSLCHPANLLILDEPTNDLDVATIAALEQMLIDQASTAIVVTHDRWFLDRVATALLVFESDARVVAYPGNHATYCRLRAQQQQQAEAAAAAAGADHVPPARPAERRARNAAGPVRRGLTYAERLELEGLFDRVAAAEARAAALEARLADPATYGRVDHGADVSALVAELELARREAEELVVRWEELEGKREEIGRS